MLDETCLDECRGYLRCVYEKTVNHCAVSNCPLTIGRITTRYIKFETWEHPKIDLGHI